MGVQNSKSVKINLDQSIHDLSKHLSKIVVNECTGYSKDEQAKFESLKEKVREMHRIALLIDSRFSLDSANCAASLGDNHQKIKQMEKMIPDILYNLSTTYASATNTNHANKERSIAILKKISKTIVSC